MDDVDAVVDAVEELKKEVSGLRLPGEAEVEQIESVTYALKEMAGVASNQLFIPSEEDVDRIVRMTDALERMHVQAMKIAAGVASMAEAAEEVESVRRR